MSTTCDKTAARGLASGGRSEICSASGADLSMNPGSEQTVESFAIKFTHLEWKYLCSYRWFLKDFAQAVDTGDFSALKVKAERALVYGRVRRPAGTTKDGLSVCHSAKWYG
jgi:hypothetical protein